MPKLIIPNAYELSAEETSLRAHRAWQSIAEIATAAAQLSNDIPAVDRKSRHIYNLRFLWLLEPGDAILLTKQPDPAFLTYLARIKNIDLSSIHIIVINNKYSSLTSACFADHELYMQLKNIMTTPSTWSIQACCYTKELLSLTDKLSIPTSMPHRQFLESDSIVLINNKITFREIGNQLSVPIATGYTCHNLEYFCDSIKKLNVCANQLIVKQGLNASGKGNIGITFNTDNYFTGVITSFCIHSETDLITTAENIWNRLKGSQEHPLIIEVYYPNKASITAQFYISDTISKPTLVRISEIKMQNTWMGVEMPPPNLPFDIEISFIHDSMLLVKYIQQVGYIGYLCCDAIVTHANEIIFTEMNVRPGAETHAYILSAHLKNKMPASHSDMDKTYLTHNCLTTKSFESLLDEFSERDLLFDKSTHTGLIILTHYQDKLEYFIAEENSTKANSINKEIQRLMSNL